VRYVISGAAGFIGSHLCERLLEHGQEIVALDNLITGHLENIEHLLDRPGFHFVNFDVTRPIELPEVTRSQVHRVMHLASLASPVDYLEHPIETLESGSTATRNMLDVARRHKAKFLLTSTSECYGDPLEHPQTETYWGNVNPVGLRSCYDESKRYAEALTMAYHRTYGVETTIARIFNTYGPRMALNDGRVVPAFIDQALRGAKLTVFGDGSQTRSFCYVSDLVNGLILLSESAERYPVNLGNPAEMTILQFAEKIRARFGPHIEIEFKPLPSDDPKVRRPDITKARRVLGWEPRVKLDQGLTLTIDYFKNRAMNPGIRSDSTSDSALRIDQLEPRPA
jgi:dTDP-glucose 4,6-dehydratase